MSRKKKIGLITICPETNYQQKIMNSVFDQCRKYNYDVLVFSPMVHSSHFFKDYLQGELNIYELINFDLLDGVIITPIPMTEDRITFIVNNLLEEIKAKCNKPVVSIDVPFGDYKTVVTDDRTPFFHITEHLIKVHGCKDIAMLTGMKDYQIAENRLQGYKDALEANNIPVKENNIFYGDFWYSGGENLARLIVEEKIPRPEAVVCASDHMAIGLTNYLIKNNIQVPKDIIVTGYEAIHEAIMNNPPITSYAADRNYAARQAVNYLHSLIEPESPEFKVGSAGIKNLCIGCTCGCNEDINYTKESIKGSQYTMDHDYSDASVWNRIDIGMLLESYMSEILTAAVDPYECLCKIYESIYLLKPYTNFFLCLNDDWLDYEKDRTSGYSSKMMLAIFSDMEKKTHGYINHVFFGKGREKFFDSKEMLPALKDDEYDTPQVFYFVPVHFNSSALGYAVLQNGLNRPETIGVVYKNFIRNINNALEMSRAKNKIADFSEHDTMTGLYNRRGMERLLAEKFKNIGSDYKWLAIVIDMDGLKMRNDNYGHLEGDAGIIAIAQAADSITSPDEICVRSGGDEFYILGAGNYTEKDVEKKIADFNEFIRKKNETAVLPLSASIGYAIEKITDLNSYEEAIEKADVNMYLDKRAKKHLTRRS